MFWGLSIYCQTPVLGLGLGVDFTFTWDNNENDNNDNDKNGNDKNNPHLNFLKGTVLWDKEQGVGISRAGNCCGTYARGAK